MEERSDPEGREKKTWSCNKAGCKIQRRHRHVKKKLGLKGGSERSEPGLKGGDLVGTISNIISRIPPPRQAPPPNIRTYLDQHQAWKVVGVQVCRVPIYSAISAIVKGVQKVASLLGAKQYEEKMKNFDALFHLYMLVTIAPPTTFSTQDRKLVGSGPFKRRWSVGDLGINPKNNPLTGNEGKEERSDPESKAKLFGGARSPFPSGSKQVRIERNQVFDLRTARESDEVRTPSV